LRIKDKIFSAAELYSAALLIFTILITISLSKDNAAARRRLRRHILHA
jgi:hypothetical protein